MTCLSFASRMTRRDRSGSAGDPLRPSQPLWTAGDAADDGAEKSHSPHTSVTLAPDSTTASRSTTGTGRLQQDSKISRGSQEYDVLVVGAGLSGLVAASQLIQAGLKVKVLEAQDRVGGRTLDHCFADGTLAEMGGQWIGPGQTEIVKLCKELGLSFHDTYDHGESLFRSSASTQVKRYKDRLPVGIIASLDLLMATRKIDRLAKGVPNKTPTKAANAVWLDERSIASWIDDEVKTSQARALLKMAIKAVYAENPESISLLDFLATVNGAGGSVENVLSDAQTTRIVEGPQQISRRLAARLPPEVVQLRTKAVSIRRIKPHHVSKSETEDGGRSQDQPPSGFRVVTNRDEWRASVVLVTPPRPLICQIHFEPALPTRILQYYRRQPMGSVIKYNILYTSPFWRKAGLNGSYINTDEKSPIQLVYDNSPPPSPPGSSLSGPGVLVAFVFANNSRSFVQQSPDRQLRRDVVLQSLAQAFGVHALSPMDFYEIDWADQPFATGGYGSFNPPGLLTSFEPDHKSSLSRVGSIFFAGDAASETWQGYMEGAVRSGKHTSNKIVDAFLGVS
ncbi:amine oxidase [Testicularia cyperi]|uniref:Amine oxidase n=1 Tax=Testicularia cyperi TaxID=1882483 RepID=A0A317XIQ1_9BASI|nr:amine oxidase [Testicularia cyperi]